MRSVNRSSEVPVSFIARLGAKSTQDNSADIGRPYLEALAQRTDAPDVATLAKVALLGNHENTYLDAGLVSNLASIKNDGVAYRVALDFLSTPLSGSLTSALCTMGAAVVKLVYRDSQNPAAETAAATARFIAPLADQPDAAPLAIAALEVKDSAGDAGRAYRLTFPAALHTSPSGMRTMLANVGEQALPDRRCYGDDEHRDLAQARVKVAGVYINRIVNDDGHCGPLMQSPLGESAREVRDLLSIVNGYAADDIGTYGLHVLSQPATEGMTPEEFLGTLGSQVKDQDAVSAVLQRLSQSDDPEVAVASELALQCPDGNRLPAAHAAFQVAMDSAPRGADGPDGFI